MNKKNFLLIANFLIANRQKSGPDYLQLLRLDSTYNHILSNPVIRDKFSKHGSQCSYGFLMLKESDRMEFGYKRLILSAPCLVYPLAENFRKIPPPPGKSKTTHKYRSI